jgi:hypothetical protein
MTRHASDSTEQQTAESYILLELERELGLNFDSSAILPTDIGVKPDAIDLENKVVVEVYARVGALKGAQLHKVKGDILKLALLEKKLGSSWRKIICFGDEQAASYLLGKSWAAEAARVFGVEIHIVRLPDDQREVIQSAQRRQRMVNA